MNPPRQSLRAAVADGTIRKAPHFWRELAVVGLLILSAVAIATAPFVMPSGYSWISHAISESAAQGQQRAWVARLGFLLFGFAVLLLASIRRAAWGWPGTLLLGLFGIFMVATAAFSHRPWQAGVPFDEFEDLLHSVTATGMGMAFAFGVLAVAIHRARTSLPLRIADVAAVAAAVVIPMTMNARPDIAGLVQRAMFLIAYAWYGAEALRASVRRAR
jgi:hypothetical protein